MCKRNARLALGGWALVAAMGCSRDPEPGQADTTTALAEDAGRVAESPSGASAPVSAASPSLPAAAAGSGTAAFDTTGAEPVATSAIPLVPGIAFTSAHTFPDGDRENLVRVTEVSPEGVVYSWFFRQQQKDGQSFDAQFERFVRANDLASAPRLDNLFITPGRTQRPGFTSFVISRATYERVRAQTETPYTVVSISGGVLDDMAGGALDGMLRSRVTLKGTLSLASPTPVPMPVLLNGRRVSVPVLHMKGRFAFQERKENSELWVLADSAHPILLRSVIEADTLQTVRIDLPQDSRTREAALEEKLERDCRVELPGVYFAFASADLQAASEPALSAVAALLARQADWSLAIEGHTDSIGGQASNQTLSMRRAEAVRDTLVKRYGIAANRLQAAGFGATRPRESNRTLEGRARNRRVELARNCADR